MADFGFRTTKNFRAAAEHLANYCGIDVKLSSERLHKIKQSNGRGGDDDVVFDFSGGVYDPVSKELLGILTTGGAKKIL